MCVQVLRLESSPATNLFDLGMSLLLAMQWCDWVCKRWRYFLPSGMSQASMSLSVVRTAAPMQNAHRFQTYRGQILLVPVFSANLCIVPAFSCILVICVAGAFDVGCLVSPMSSSMEYVDVSVMNLHFHANAEHTRTGATSTYLACNLAVWHGGCSA